MLNKSSLRKFIIFAVYFMLFPFLTSEYNKHLEPIMPKFKWAKEHIKKRHKRKFRKKLMKVIQ